MHGNKPCWHCRHFAGWRIQFYTNNGAPYAMAICNRGQPSIEPQPQFGCAYWSREPGSDDEPGCVDPIGRRYRPTTRN